MAGCFRFKVKIQLFLFFIPERIPKVFENILLAVTFALPKIKG